MVSLRDHTIYNILVQCLWAATGSIRELDRVLGVLRPEGLRHVCVAHQCTQVYNNFTVFIICTVQALQACPPRHEASSLEISPFLKLKNPCVQRLHTRHRHACETAQHARKPKSCMQRAKTHNPRTSLNSFKASSHVCGRQDLEISCPAKNRRVYF